MVNHPGGTSRGNEGPKIYRDQVLAGFAGASSDVYVV
jgi:ATP-dependent protease HslVU (ClpYQ) peptidase subunit